MEVAAESLSSDVWAWRKYGQKPIKGSPHPRYIARSFSLSLIVNKNPNHRLGYRNDVAVTILKLQVIPVGIFA